MARRSIHHLTTALASLTTNLHAAADAAERLAAVEGGSGSRTSVSLPYGHELDQFVNEILRRARVAPGR